MEGRGNDGEVITVNGKEGKGCGMKSMRILYMTAEEEGHRSQMRMLRGKL